MIKPKGSMVIIDDEVNVLKMLSELFEAKGWNVFAVPTGEAGVDVIKEEEINIVLLDITLPGKSGLDILKEIKKEKKDLPVIVMTGRGYDDDLVKETLQAGAAGYVSKGVGIKELLEVVANTLAQGENE